jgi:tripartite-type tricarboxylate transporter receptor subunit TctC
MNKKCCAWVSTVSLLVIYLGLIKAGVAQNYPFKPIRLVVPQSAGGSTDLVARPLAQRAAEGFKSAVVVDNRPGAGSIIGTDLVAKAPADGYTLLAVAVSFSMSPSLYKKLPFDPLTDFAPISLLTSMPNLMVVHPAEPIYSVRDFIRLAKSHQGQLNYSSSGLATGTYMSMELFKYLTAIQMQHVPYKGGAPSVAALMSHEVNVCLATISTALPHVKSGRLRGLAVSTLRRSMVLPEMPTIDEAGVAGYDYSSWIGLLAPAKTAQTIVQSWHRQVVLALQASEIKALLQLEGSEAVGDTPQAFGRRIKSEIERWRAVGLAAGMKPE